jgi:NAD(P)-dependent dehydrogenase (short-subunit alcohol dehydrogenase family)
MEDPERVAIITGGSRGIGFATAQRMADRGWAVCITGRKEQPLLDAAGELGRHGAAVLPLTGHSTDPDHQTAVVDAVLDRWGRVDVLVNNAATSPYFGPLLDASHAQITRAFETNVIGPWAWCQLVWARSMRQRGGAIVNVASVGGLYPVPQVALYNLSKAALIHMTKQLALELAPSVRVNAVAPATVKTDFSRAKYEGREAEVAEQYLLPRLGTADEVADIVVALCGHPYEWVTGQTIVLDGGASLVRGVK